MDFSRIAVIGPGLLGGSLIRAIRYRAGGAIELRAWGRREEPLRQLLAEGAVTTASTDIGAVARDADLIVLCTTVGAMGGSVRAILQAGSLAPGCVVTDVGSVKSPVVAELEPLIASAGGRFIGSHPMAGSEQGGLENASADLFEGAACLITPTETSDPAAMESVEALWRWLGCRTHRLDPAAHDRAVALISHLPHIVAAILTESILGTEPGAGQFAGGGFRDSTRIAGGSPDMWTEILLENRDAVRDALRQFHHLTGETLAFFDGMRKEDLHRLLASAKKRRDAFRLGRSDPNIET
jgi:prephenate dehydrogenase